MAIEDRSVLSDEDKKRRLEQVLLELAQKVEGLPPGGPHHLVAQRTDYIRTLADGGNVAAALRAAESLSRATRQFAAPDLLETADQRLQQAPEAAKTALRVLELRVKDARAAGDAAETRKCEAELKEALALAEKTHTEGLAEQAAAAKINRLAMERSAFGFDHMMISTEARVRQTAAV